MKSPQSSYLVGVASAGKWDKFFTKLRSQARRELFSWWHDKDNKLTPKAMSKLATCENVEAYIKEVLPAVELHKLRDRVHGR